jgi:hypothetical protein
MLDLTSCAQITDDAIEGIVSNCPKIRNLVVAKCSIDGCGGGEYLQAREAPALPPSGTHHKHNGSLGVSARQILHATEVY